MENPLISIKPVVKDKRCRIVINLGYFRIQSHILLALILLWVFTLAIRQPEKVTQGQTNNLMGEAAARMCRQ
jgi:hypothetical protein